ncbi:GNAT family N-acetyltransferase [Planococcus sp. CPCC 101016]|uniref:GNAT family N-acetyltransferase n=1 Tax=Planococcus sp. CPCC 101016 TaxID=2599617 RepID=UPI0011B448F8|nr:GNAT family N-acetyltransferase [Planococcus sp. CPCC 101016]TWT07907.1 GNAT family N-acetyltransferase [Planococcus sp. CPCC 101016]
MIIRKAVPSDAGQLAALIKHVEESNFMLFEPGERKTTAEQLHIRLLAMGENSIVLVAEEQQQLTAYLFAINEDIKRKKHSVYVAMGVRQGERGKGRGTKLFLALEEWAQSRNLHRIELTVLEHNSSAIALYKKMGFKVEGLKRDSLYIANTYANELFMSKIL